MPVIHVDPSVYERIRRNAQPNESTNRTLRRMFDLGPEPVLSGAAAVLTAGCDIDGTDDGVVMPIPDDAPFRECVTACWIDAQCRQVLEYGA